MLLQGKAFRKRIKYEFLKAFMRFTLYGDFFIFLLYLFPFFFTLTQIRIIIYLINPRQISRVSKCIGVFLSRIFSFLNRFFIFFFNTFTPFSVLPCFVKFANQVLDVYAVPVARFFFVQLLAWPGCILHHITYQQVI